MDLPPNHRWIPRVFTGEECGVLQERLIAEIDWEEHQFRMFGRSILMPRKIAFFGPWDYAYSGTVHTSCATPDFLEKVMGKVSECSGHPFNTLLLNYYMDGSKSMGWHSDDDYDHGGYPAVASLSVGATRRFRVRTREHEQSWGLDLAAGGLLVMEGKSQEETQHSVPKTARECGPRINLTFRHMACSNQKKTRAI